MSTKHEEKQRNPCPQQRIRIPTRTLLGSTANTFCVSFRDFLRIQRCAWFNYGYMHCVSLRSLLKTLTHFLSAGGLREMTSGLSPYSSLSLVRQRIHALRQSTRLSGSVVFLWEMTSGLSPYSALSLVRQLIHALRQSTSLSGCLVFLWEMTSGLSPYSALSLGRQWIHVGFSLCGFWKSFTRFLREGGLGPRGQALVPNTATDSTSHLPEITIILYTSGKTNTEQ